MNDKQEGEFERESQEIVEHYERKGLSRREIVQKAGLGVLGAGVIGAAISACGGGDDEKRAVAASGGSDSGEELAILGTNGGLVATWYAQGKESMEHWGNVFNGKVTWVDGELDATKQRAKMDRAATDKWDIVAAIAVQPNTIVDPLKKMIDNGALAFQMVSDVGKDGEDWGYTSWVEQDSKAMGFEVASALFKKAGGQGTVIETQGPSTFTGAQQRHAGFEEALKAYPNMELLTTDFADWDPKKAQQLWETYVNKYDDITVGYFHNDDMAFAGLQALKSAGRDGKTLIGGADAMPPAVDAVRDGQFVATVRHSGCMVHAWPVIIGQAMKRGIIDSAPKKIQVNGPVVTPENAESVKFLQSENVYLQ